MLINENSRVFRKQNTKNKTRKTVYTPYIDVSFCTIHIVATKKKTQMITDIETQFQNKTVTYGILI